MNNELQIVERLYDLTKSNKKVWSRTNLVSQFTVESGKGRFKIVQNDPDLLSLGPQPPLYQLLILNNENEIIESIDVESKDKNTRLFMVMKNLWDEIQDKYYKKSETIKSIKEDLGLF